MPADKWTILVVPDEDAAVRQFSVSRRLVRRTLLGGGGFVLALLGLVAMVGMGGASKIQSFQLERKNALLTQELEELRLRVGSLQGNLEQLSDRDAEVRALAGLESLDEEVRQVGVGGPGSLTSPDDHPLWSVDPELGKAAFAVSYDLNVLERRVKLLTESFSVATDSLEAHRNLLESTPSILPTAGRLTSRFSNARLHPIHHRTLPHEGVDISAPQGTPILAAAKGRVTFAGRKAGYGLVVELDHGFGYETLYGHASQLLVREGQEVRRGEVIAQVGRTGIATSAHLHYEVRVAGRPMNPMNYVISGAVP
ncbi:MAG: M23 family metallopeptidase [Gemmatimonadota bacterium]